MKYFKIDLWVEVDSETDLRDLVEYTNDALGCWGGQRHPSDPLFGGINVLRTNFKAIRKPPK